MEAINPIDTHEELRPRDNPEYLAFLKSDADNFVENGRLDMLLDFIKEAELPISNEQKWHEKANCRGSDTEIFFPGPGKNAKKARSICKDCAVRDECGNFALTTNQEGGIWDGKNKEDRRLVRRELRMINPEEDSS